MSRHFTATILLDRPWKLDIDRLAGALRKRFPRIGTVAATSGQGRGDAGVLTLDGAQIVVESTPGRAPVDRMRPDLNTLRFWDPSEALDRHAARLTISCGGELPGLDGAEAYAAATHFAATAALKEVPALAVIWDHGWTIHRPTDFAEMATGLLAGRMPVNAWVSFAPVVPRGHDPALATGMVTYGLAPMIGRELELAPRPGDPRRAWFALSEIVRRMLDRGLVLSDGQVVTSEGVDFTARARTYWLRRGSSAFVLVAPDAVVDAETLRPHERAAA